MGLDDEDECAVAKHERDDALQALAAKDEQIAAYETAVSVLYQTCERLIGESAALREALVPFACSCIPGVCRSDNERSGQKCASRTAREIVGPYPGMPTSA